MKYEDISTYMIYIENKKWIENKKPMFTIKCKSDEIQDFIWCISGKMHLSYPQILTYERILSFNTISEYYEFEEIRKNNIRESMVDRYYYDSLKK